MSLWGISSDGRAPALHAGGQGFESLILHHFARVRWLDGLETGQSAKSANLYLEN